MIINSDSMYNLMQILYKALPNDVVIRINEEIYRSTNEYYCDINIQEHISTLIDCDYTARLGIEDLNNKNTLIKIMCDYMTYRFNKIYKEG